MGNKRTDTNMICRRAGCRSAGAAKAFRGGLCPECVADFKLMVGDVSAYKFQLEELFGKFLTTPKNPDTDKLTVDQFLIYHAT